MASVAGPDREEVVNHLANSQSTSKTMADGAIAGFCTLPRAARTSSPADRIERQQATERGSNGGHYYTLRPQATMGTVGGRLRPSQSVTDVPGEDRTELNRSLLYEQNMCTFENFCERRQSAQLLQHTRDEEASDGTREGLVNFCTLRKVRRPGMEHVAVHAQPSDEDRQRRQQEPFGGAYCTLKKKKLQLNRKFVESFLEDPNAKVVDYLSELDAYLDEMDDVDDAYDDVASEGDSEGNDHGSISEVTPTEAKCSDTSDTQLDEQRLQYSPSRRHPQGGAEECGLAATYQDDRIRFGDIKHFCTLPKQKRTQFLNAFKRGASLRRTTVSQAANEPVSTERNGPIPETRTQCDVPAEDGGDASDLPAHASIARHRQSGNDGPTDQHAPSWHRNSMRKKHLIELPEQEITDHRSSSPPPVAPSGGPSSNDSLSESNDFSSICTLPVGEIPAPDHTESLPTLVVALPPSPGPFPDPEQPTAPPPLETDLDGDDSAVLERPRQTGRRAQSQPRIGSITVVRDTATNELIIRTNSVPATAPPEANQTEPQQRNLNHQRRYAAGDSEGSSIGSSRNPSPVSLLSTTTTYSSIASAPDNADDRTRHLTEPMRDGSEGTGTSSHPPDGSTRDDVSTIARNSIGQTVNGRRQRNSSEVQRRHMSTSTQADSSVVSSGPEDRTAPEDDSEPDVGPQRSSRRSDGRPKARWPHAVSRALATTFCTLGLFNISRFAVFSVHFGANFVIQFLLFSLLFGIPMLWLQMVLGARIRGGPVTMWRISPICKGIGIALLLAQALLTLYSAISLAWVLVYFRDAFIMRNEKYRWQEPFEAYRGVGQGNQSYRLEDTVADYFNGVVLQRYHLAHKSLPVGNYGGRILSSPTTARASGVGAIRFQLAFNMAILWTLVFVALCRGIRSLGKVVIGLFLGAFVSLTAVCAKFLTILHYDSIQNIFPAADWQDFFFNSHSWTSAAQETFLTWGLLGISVYAINCRSNRKGSCNVRTRRELRRDAFLVAFITLAVLLLAAVLGTACVQILNSHGYYYFPGSYESLDMSVFLRPNKQALPIPFIRYSSVVGESFKRSYANPSRDSGYQALRLVTELLPASLAAAAPDRIAPVWGLVGYLALLLFGLGQLCVMWRPVAGAIGDTPSSILLSCVTGLLLGMPLATEGGISIVHYLDTILGAAWWVLLLWIGHILALFLVRGRPFTSDILVNDLQVLQSFSAFVAFAWNFLLPIGLIFLCIIQYRLSNSAALFNWSTVGSAAGANAYWPLWARQVGGFVQVGFLLLVPIVMVVQIYRYLCRGPPDILDRVDLLLRPPVDGDPNSSSRSVRTRHAAVSVPLQQGTTGTGSGRDGSEPTISLPVDSRSQRDTEDAPPKYTPPPSYTTATGARIAKLLRNSIRRSVRRLMGEPSGGTLSVRHRTALPQTIDGQTANPSAGGELPPPDYCSALQQYAVEPGTLELQHTMPRALYNSDTFGTDRRYRSLNAAGDAATHAATPQQQPLTAYDVRHILRPSISHPNGANPAPGFTQTLRNTLLRRGHSMENLVLAAAPLGDSSIITLNDDDEVFDDGHGPRTSAGRPDAMGRDSVI